MKWVGGSKLFRASIKSGRILPFASLGDILFFTAKEGTMDIEAFRQACLAKAEVTEGMPFGEDVLVFKVFHKMFATLRLDGEYPAANLKCNPERAVQLREEYTDIQPGYHMNKKHWNTLHLSGELPPALILELLDHSYQLVVAGLTRKQQRTITERISNDG